MVKIYLPNDEKSLKECEIMVKYNSALNFINKKSIELGADVENYCWWRDSKITKINLAGKRYSKEQVWVNRIETHDFIHGMSRNSGYETVERIFSNEDPIIFALLDAIKKKKSCLNHLKDAYELNGASEKITEHFYNDKKVYMKLLREYFNNNYSEIISLEKLLKYIQGNSDVILNFLNNFVVFSENYNIISLEEIEDTIKRYIDFAGLIPVNVQPYFLEFANKEFEKNKVYAKGNEKVLSYKLDL